MQAKQIRDKYRRILEEPQQESDDQWEQAYSQMTRHRKKKILAQVHHPNTTNGQSQQNSNSQLALKQKLAQCLSNCKDHCKEIEQFKKEQILFNEERLEWRNEERELNGVIEAERQRSSAHFERIKQLQKQMQELMGRCQEEIVEKQLQQKQAQFYKAQLSQLKVGFENKEREFKLCQKEIKTVQKLKKQNQYLKYDVQRMCFLIEDATRFGRVSGQLMKKHFLGKPHRELQFWYPQQLVGEVQHFLKKSQVGHGNRQFTTNLIKFIEKVSDKSKEEPRSKHSISHSRGRQKQSVSLKKSHKLHTFEGSSIKKNAYTLNNLKDEHIHIRTQSNSFWKSNDSRLTNSVTPTFSIALVKSHCWDVVSQFRSIVFELLLEKEVKRKKIKKLIDSMSSGLMELFEGHSHLKQYSFGQDKSDFQNFRLVTQDPTAPLK